MIVKATTPCWLFSTNISESELSSAFLNRAKFFSVTQMSSILNDNSLSTEMCTREDYLRVKTQLSQLFHGADSSMLDELVGLLSRPLIDEDFFEDSWNTRRWSLNASFDVLEYFHRYVTLLALAVDSAPWPNSGWPHGRISLQGFDGNYSAKFLENVFHCVVRDERDEPDLSPFQTRLLMDDLIVFATVLAAFADDINDDLWSILLSVVRQIRASRLFAPFRQKFDVGLDSALTGYFLNRGLETQETSEFSDIRLSPDRAMYRSHVADTSPFWECLNQSINGAIPAWAANCTVPGAQIAGLVSAAISGDPFARRFVTIDLISNGLPLVACTFEAWSDALGLENEEISEAFNVVDMKLLQVETFHDRRFYFNT